MWAETSRVWMDWVTGLKCDAGGFVMMPPR